MSNKINIFFDIFQFDNKNNFIQTVQRVNPQIPVTSKQNEP